MRTELKVTISNAEKTYLISALIGLAVEKIEDIESGCEEGIYEDDQDNADELKHLKDLIEQAKLYSKSQPEIYIMVEGGIIQGASATESMSVNIYDIDNMNAGDSDDEKEFLENFGTPEEWDAMIKEKTENGTLTSVY